MSADKQKTILERIYTFTHKKHLKNGGAIPYYWKFSLTKVISKPIRKFFSAIVIPTIPFSNLRVWCYRRCGYKIGKNVFIGMRCYLDDMCYDKITIGDNVIISYGVFFACHGRGQGHNNLIIKNGAYIGMKTSIIARHDLTIGENSVVGACSMINKDVPDNATVVGTPARQIARSKVSDQ